MAEMTTGSPAGVVVRVEALVAGYRPGRPVLHGVGVSVRAGESVALVGRNGSGKSTLLHCLAGQLRPMAGRVLVGPGELAEVGRLSARRRAQRIGLLHQALPTVPGLTVRALVEQGRYAHHHPLFGSAGGDAAVDEALAEVGLLDRADQLVDALSGGQRQRARLAVVLAQRAPIVLLDEPLAHLDIRHQLLLRDLVVRLRAERGLTVVTVLHELDHLAGLADRVVVLDDGRVVADGPVDQVIRPQLLAQVFGVRARVLTGADAGRVLVDEPV